LVVTLCLDEIFCHQRPILVGVEPHRLTWVIGVAAANRAGPTWCQAVAAWPHVTYVAADGGTGLHRGLELAYQQRQQAGPPLPLAVNLDNFHIQQEGHRAVRAEWQEAERRWAAAEEADRRLAAARRQGRDLRGRTVQAGNAWVKAQQAYAVAERHEAAWRRAVAALAVFRPDGRLNDRSGAEAEIRAAVADLTGPRWAKTCRMLLDPRALAFLDRWQRDLEAAEPRAGVRAAVAAVWRRESVGRRRLGPPERLVLQLRILACRQLDAAWPAAYRRVARVLRQAVRASSVVECMNSVIRMHQARHRGLSQGLLDLKRLFWNSRAFAAGKRKGRCPYAHLGLDLPTDDAWELLQMEPAELAQRLGVEAAEWAQEVSTTDVAA
jgi:hypothetical protein